jgi:hypothetical protein
MIAHSPHLSKLGVSKLGGKLLEIAGAACASACAAVLLGNLREPPYPPAPPIVRLAPADEQAIHYVGTDGMALVAEIRAARRHSSSSEPASVAPTVSE